MGTKIVELPVIPSPIGDDDIIPISKISSLTRNTYKTTVSELGIAITADVNTRINNLTTATGSYLPLAGGTMSGNINLDGKKLLKFSGEIKVVTADTTLTPEYNGCIILVEKGPRILPDDRVLLNITKGSLPVGFNAVVIQTGAIQAKISTLAADVFIVNADDSLSSRQLYSQINICVIKSTALADVVWISGDII